MSTKTKNTNDERKSRGRFMDQPGQWSDKTPKSVKKKQAAAWKKLEKSIRTGK